MIILGIDPGYAIVGIGVIEYKGNKFRPLEYNAITTNAHTMTSHRLKIIYDEINISCDLPNINTLLRIYFESEIIDEFDPTLNEYKQNKLSFY